jgi:hypothetical protein
MVTEGHLSACWRAGELDELVKEVVAEEERLYGDDDEIGAAPEPVAPEPIAPQDNEAGEDG